MAIILSQLWSFWQIYTSPELYRSDPKRGQETWDVGNLVGRRGECSGMAQQILSHEVQRRNQPISK